jgi:hypothetical protein
MREGTTEKSRIEKETVRALLVANGAGAVAMLAVLPSVLDRTGYQALAQGLLVGLLAMTVGVVLAILHNHLRSRIPQPGEPQNVRPQQQNIGSQQHGLGSQHNPNQQPMRPVSVEAKPAGSSLALASAACLWLSVAAFLGAGAFVAVSGMTALDGFQNRGMSPPTATVGEQKGKQKTKQ